MEFLLDGIRAVTPQQCVMYVVGALLIYLAIKKDYEPSLLLPMGFGAILVNLPMSGVLNQMVAGVGESQGIIQWLFETTIEASEALPLLLFIGIGAMIDFGPLLSNPKMFLFGAAAQFGIFFAMIAAVLLGFDGLMAALARLILHLGCLESFGAPYTAPFTDRDAPGALIGLIKRPNTADKFRSPHLAGRNKRRQK